MPKITADPIAQHRCTVKEQEEKEANIRQMAATLEKANKSWSRTLDQLQDLYNLGRNDLIFICQRR